MKPDAINRRLFAASAGAALALPAAGRSIKAGLLTDANGPHLGAYIEGLAASPEASSISVCDPSGQSLTAARKAFGARLGGVYRDPAELFAKEKPELALITLEAKAAPPVIDKALDAGCHIMAEKPSCVRLEDFEPLARKATATGHQLMLALANRVDPIVLEMKKRVQAGEFGKIYGVDLQIVADQTRLTKPAYHQTWTAKKSRAGGGHLIWLGIHWLDLAMYIANSNIQEVASLNGNVGGQPLDVEDSAVAAIRFSNGSFGTVTSGYYLDKGYHSLIKIWGSHGWIEMRKHGGPVPLVWYSTKEAKPVEHTYTGPTEPSGYTPFVQQVVRFAAGAGPAPLTTADSLRALRVVFACYRSAESGKKMGVS